MVQLSAAMEQTHETQLAQLYGVLGFRRVIARYDVLSTRHETGPRGVMHEPRQLRCLGLFLYVGTLTQNSLCMNTDK